MKSLNKMDTTLNNKGGYKGTGATGTFNGVTYGAPTASSPYGTYSLSELNNATPVKIPPTTPPTFGGLSGALEAGTNSDIKNEDFLNAETLKKSSDIANADVLRGILEAGNTSAGVDYTEQDIARKEANKYSQQIQAEQLALRRQQENILKNNPTGALRGGQADLLANIERESLSKQADIAILKAGATQDYETAKSIADRQVALNTEQAKMKLEAYKFIADTAQGEYKTALEQKIKKADAELKKQEETEKAIANIKIEAVKNGLKDLSGFANVKTLDEALSKAGSYLANGNIEFQKVGDNVLRIDKLTGKVLNTYGGGSSTSNNFAITKNTLDTINGGDIVKTIANVINTSGAKQSQQTNDAINVISGVQQLANANPDGRFIGAAPGIGFGWLRGADARKQRIANQSAFDAINLKVQQWASGAALTEQQTKQVKKLTPDKNDTDFKIREKLNALTNYMVGQVSGQLAGQGIGFAMEPVDLFNRKPLDQDPLKVFGGSTGGQDSLGLGI